jgi:hypothetical protein
MVNHIEVSIQLDVPSRESCSLLEKNHRWYTIREVSIQPGTSLEVMYGRLLFLF